MKAKFYQTLDILNRFGYISLSSNALVAHTEGFPMEDRPERRKHPRYKLKWPINVLTDDGVTEGETRDVGPDGISVCVEQPLRLNETFRMGIMPPDHAMIEFTGKVIWSDLYCMGEEDTTYGVGLCLVEISEDERHFFQEVLDDPPQE